jgi:hypothetical protein
MSESKLTVAVDTFTSFRRGVPLEEAPQSECDWHAPQVNATVNCVTTNGSDFIVGERDVDERG